MDETANFLRDWWPIAVCMVGLVGWFFRLESRAMANGDDIKREGIERGNAIAAMELRIERTRREDLEQRKQDRDDTNRILSDVQSDIKQLLRQISK